MSTGPTSASYSKRAHKYEKKWAEYLNHTHVQLLKRFGSKPGDKVLDISAGTGLFAEHLIEAGYEFDVLTLNDISAGMLQVAKQRFKNAPRVGFSCSLAEALEFESASFDTVISMNAFHNYADQEKALYQIKRVLKPGGCFYLLDWNRTGLFRFINFVISLVVHEIINTRSSDEIREMLIDNGLNIEEEKKWNFRYWNFYLFKAVKPK